MKVAIRAGGSKAAPRAQSVRKRNLSRTPLVVKNGFQRSPTKRKQDIGGPPTNPPPKDGGGGGGGGGDWGFFKGGLKSIFANAALLGA
eukprot:CAMPEP_0183826104 /NCGR_PEP_ID=MMETSP0807_2-20130328/1518_1 /TAXON_ID=88271 /ORGANISM="Picocystis salinarum, Strain CCMP1897" /LENGTH=87 /DNA_ID=CAMNT_0026071185 /DNA_START=165 /DNA_END=424 /DNA_ORIENTATION=+